MYADISVPIGLVAKKRIGRFLNDLIIGAVLQFSPVQIHIDPGLLGLKPQLCSVPPPIEMNVVFSQIRQVSVSSRFLQKKMLECVFSFCDLEFCL